MSFRLQSSTRLAIFMSFVSNLSGVTRRKRSTRPLGLRDVTLASTSSSSSPHVRRTGGWALQSRHMNFTKDMADLNIVDNTGDGPLRVPGFKNLPLNYKPDDSKIFAHGADEWCQPRMTAREVAMLGVMNSLTEKSKWHEKVFDEDIVAKWRSEALAMPLVSERAWEWCLAELRDKADIYKITERVLVLDSASRVCKANNLVHKNLSEELKKAAKPLLDANDKDWHPGSNDQVLNLVHPSLFPLIYGRTRVLLNGGKVDLDNCLTSIGDGEVASLSAFAKPDRRPHGYENHRWSHRFQWLPCEVEFTGNGNEVRITSYINNLHPRHEVLYRLIENVIELAIVPWNDVLLYTKFGARNPLRILTYEALFDPPFPEFFKDLPNEVWPALHNREGELYRSIKEKVDAFMELPERNLERVEDEKEGSDDDEESLSPGWEERFDLYTATQIKWKRVRNVVHPEPGISFTYEDWKEGKNTHNAIPEKIWHFTGPSGGHDYYTIKLQEQFRKEGLQVIVKLASIELTPEKFRYAGGSWHIEGLLNEHIAATAIFYYDVANTTESRVSFRTEAVFDEPEMVYLQEDHAPLAETFGIASVKLRYVPAIQELGSVPTAEGLLLAFPNVLQHKVEPFELVDKTMPGHRRFLVLWLVDPHYRICSTRNVPPQRQNWRASDVPDKASSSSLPMEAVDVAPTDVEDWPIRLEEAKKLRLELMAERTVGTQQIQQEAKQYNFCEH